MLATPLPLMIVMVSSFVAARHGIVQRQPDHRQRLSFAFATAIRSKLECESEKCWQNRIDEMLE
jgi:hypothetical protein